MGHHRAATAALCVLLASLAAAHAEPAAAAADEACASGAGPPGEAGWEPDPDEDAPPGTVSLLQTRTQLSRSGRGSSSARVASGDSNLVFMHMPFNFGHTIEKVAAFGTGAATMPTFHKLLRTYGDFSGQNSPTPGESTKVPGIAWGHISPLLQEVSNVTGCPLYYTPQKHWPKDLAEKYFGSGSKVFGVLRDPYERLVAGFRGDNPQYGASEAEFFATCDVNAAVKRTMKRYLAGGSEFAKGCSLLPQAEYFDGAYGISVPVDNRQFPASMNSVFEAHGYTNMTIHTEDIFHVTGCSEIWAADLDSETRAMVRQVYKRDFELLCKHFGYCNPEENTCIWQVPQMCPGRVLASGYRGRA